MHIEVVRQSPTRSPQWRSQRVAQMLSARPSPLKPTRFDDSYVRRYRRLLIMVATHRHDLSECEDDLQSLAVAMDAHRIFYARDWERRQRLEAYLLTELSLEDIAKRFGIRAEVVEFFEKTFFDVRERMQSSDWAYMAVRGEFRMWGALPEESNARIQQGFVLRMLGYYGGSQVLQTFLDPAAGLPRPESAEEFAEWEAQVAQRTLQTRSLAAMATMPLNAKNAMRLIRSALKLPKPSPSVGDSGDRLYARINMVLDRLETISSAQKK
jgi:hypothetical protein